MSEPFDPYYTWLGIAADEQPADHYRLLGIRRFEANAEVIRHAADRVLGHLRTFQIGPHSADSQKLLNHVSAATLALLNDNRKQEYDQSLMQAQDEAYESPPEQVGEAWTPLVIQQYDAPPPLPLPSAEPIFPQFISPVAPPIVTPLALGASGLPLPTAQPFFQQYDPPYAPPIVSPPALEPSSFPPIQVGAPATMMAQPRSRPAITSILLLWQDFGILQRTRWIIVSLLAVLLAYLMLSMSSHPADVVEESAAVEMDDSSLPMTETLCEQALDDSVLQSPEFETIETETVILTPLNLPAVDDPFAAPPQIGERINAPRVDVTQIPMSRLKMRSSVGVKNSLLGKFGGTASTETAVRNGLAWLKKQQRGNGSWSLTVPYNGGGHDEDQIAATALALLAFQGAGHTSGIGDFKREVKRGWDFLLACKQRNGEFDDGSSARLMHRAYAQALATLAICDYYDLTREHNIGRAAQSAVDFAENAQSPEGGWRYEPRRDFDTSVTSWYVAALCTAQNADLAVPTKTLRAANSFLDRVSSEGGSRYAYKQGHKPSNATNAAGLYCRQLLGWKADDERLVRGIEHLLKSPLDYAHQDVYAWYYCTEAIRNTNGTYWDAWNNVMRAKIPEQQVTEGAESGSWPAVDDKWNQQGGRLFVTCMSVLILESYYRSFRQP